MPQRTERRLAAIVAADVVGYSRLMGRDEVGTLDALRGCRSDVIDPLLAGHGGRLVKTMGDGLLLEFPSAVAAAEFAVATQEALAARNAHVATDAAIRFRIGIHVGDVIIEGEDIFGDGVNVAARVEPLAAPGGVAITEDAHRQIRDRLEIEWIDGGEHDVKNIDRPLHVWHWPADPAEEHRAVAASPLPTEAAKPSIAVLPFDNMSGDPEQEFFADGMTEDLITDLSKLSGVFVLSRTTTSVYKGASIDVRDAATRLGVRYVVEGSVRKAGARVRINVKLTDATQQGHLWAERYDGTVDNVFEVQDAVGAKVIAALSVRLSRDESARLQQVHTHDLEAYELYVQAKATPYPPVPERLEAAGRMFERVIEMDPGFAGGYAGLAVMLGLGGLLGHGDLSTTATQALELATRATEVDDSFGWGHVAMSAARLLDGRHEEAISAADAAVDRQPGDADVHAYRGLALTLAGRPAEGSEAISKAILLNPGFINGPYLNLLGLSRLLAGDHHAAMAAFEENMDRGGPVGPPALAWAAGALEWMGDHERARRFAEDAMGRMPTFRLSTWNLLELIRDSDQRRRLHDIMGAAGIPN